MMLIVKTMGRQWSFAKQTLSKISAQSNASIGDGSWLNEKIKFKFHQNILRKILAKTLGDYEVQSNWVYMFNIVFFC